MGELYIAALAMTGLAFVFGLVLAGANRFLRVESDPRIEQVEEMLPGSNCGACGQAGCRAFAETVVAGDSAPGKCTVSAPEGIDAIASFLGVDAGQEEKRVARLHCAGGRSAVSKLARYDGLSSCSGAVLVARGGRTCAYGCLGFGDCQRACTFDAIAMSAEDLPVVNEDACTACGDCVVACPLSLFTLEPLADPVLVRCSSPLEGERARATCAVACDACGRCAADAPEGVIEMSGGLPRVHQPQAAPEACTHRCPTGAIAWWPEARDRDRFDVPLDALRRRCG